MCKLQQLGVKGSLWTLIDDCHTDTFCSVAVNQKNSNWFPISQGVRQGGVLSTFLFLVFINDLLQELQNQNPNTGIHSIRSSNPALADDISCISYHHEVFNPFSTQLTTSLLDGDSNLTQANLMFYISLKQASTTVLFPGNLATTPLKFQNHIAILVFF